MTTQLHALLQNLTPANTTAAQAVQARAAQNIRPPQAHARLDNLAVHMAAWQSTETPTVEKPALIVFAANHGVAAGGVSAFGAEITEAIFAAVQKGAATVSVLAKHVGVTYEAVDVGIANPSGDIRTEDALSIERFNDVCAQATSAVDAAADRGADLLILGEVGIGNTTVAAAVANAIVGDGPQDAANWVGRGSGVDDEGLARKIAAVEAATARLDEAHGPIERLRKVGGAELVAIAAACMQARKRQIPVVVDGFIATAALAPLHSAQPQALDHCIFGHTSAEAAHQRLLAYVGATGDREPLLSLNLRLGEGSGAIAAVPLIKLGCAGVIEVPTFDEWFGS